jgi:hypothetical protein
MTTAESKSGPVIGFLTVIECPENGLFGGYLVLNKAGRPLEFQCTAPIKPNRAQQILYGPTLEPFLFGEQIGRTLLSKSRLEPLAVLTDRRPALAIREHVDVPAVLVLAPESADQATQAGDIDVHRVDSAHSGAELTTFRLGRNCLAVPRALAADYDAVQSRLADIAQSLDLAEPFARIRDAIAEARRGGP